MATTTTITLRGDETLEELAGLARKLFQKARADRKAAQLRMSNKD